MNYRQFVLAVWCNILLVSNAFVVPPVFKMITQEKNKIPIVSLKDLYDEIDHHKIDRVILSNDFSTAVAVEEDETISMVTVNPFMISNLVDKCLTNKVDTIFSPKEESSIFQKTFSFATDFLIFGGFLYILNRFIFGVGGGAGGRLPTNPFSTPEFEMEIPTTNLTDWAGSPEIFQECYEVVSFLNNSEKFVEIGAKVPKGVLLNGPPGTGKTLLAKAIAAETGATFFSTVASEFVELYVGMGARRIRALFDKARQYKPSIIFIDEIDAIGKQRGSSGMSSNDEREQTLNQLLSEMDGFSPNDEILVIAATNRKDTMDEALLRPGRFDRIIPIPLPDVNSRLHILKVHLSNKKISDKVTPEFLRTLSENTDGCSGAQLANIVNEACIYAVRDNRTEIEPQDMSSSFEKSLIGVTKLVDTRSAEIRRRVAIHEIGHALLAATFDDFKLDKISIQQTYNGAGGYTLYSNKKKEEEGLYTKDYLFHKIAVMLGGKAAETVFYGQDGVSTGATNDLQQANQLIYQVMRKFGMGAYTPNFYETSQQQYSEQILSDLDKEASEILEKAFNKAFQLIKENKEKILFLIPKLMEHKIMSGLEFIKYFDL